MDFLDVVTRGKKGIEFRLEESGDSAIAERTIGELHIREKTGAIVLAIRTAEGALDTTPSAGDRLRAGDTLIVLGSRGQIERLGQLIRGEEITEEKASLLRTVDHHVCDTVRPLVVIVYLL